MVGFEGRLHERHQLAGRVGVDAHCVDDWELLRLSWLKWGAEAPDVMLGDFAFVLWDQGQHLLFAARDIGGARPLYYAYDEGRALHVAGDLRGLVHRLRALPKLDLSSVRLWFESEGGGFLPERTLLEGVRKLPPGYALTFDGYALRIYPWWRPERLEPRDHQEDLAYVEEASALVREAVACRVRGAAGRVGAHVSGGLDCSSVAVLAQRELASTGGSVLALSWSPPRDALTSCDVESSRYIDERLLVDAVASSTGMPRQYALLTVDDVVRHARRDITVEPTETLLLELAASREAVAAGVRTVVSGWGGDELIAFNGRGYFAGLLRRGRLRQLHRALVDREGVMGIPVWKQYIASGLLPLLPFEVPVSYAPSRLRLPAALDRDFAEAIVRAEPLPQPSLRERPGVRRMQLALLRSGHLSQRIESWASHGATVGIDYVYPLLDRRVIEFALSVPDHLYMRNGWKRWLYRAATEGCLPHEVRWNKHKMDPAAFEQARRVYEAARPALAAQLRERDGHPLVDVQAVARAVECPVPATPAERRRWWRRLPRRTDDPQNAAWLAFVDPVTGW